MGPTGASTTEAVNAGQKQPSQMQAGSVRVYPIGPLNPEAAQAIANNSKVTIHVPNCSEPSDELTPEQIDQQFRKLRDRYPPSKEFNLYLDNLSLQLNCPPPLLSPEPYPPHPGAPLPYPLAAYTVHAPVPRTRAPAPPHHDTLSSSTSLRYRLMGKAATDPRFHYAPPSRPVSRIHSAAAMRSTPEPAHRSHSRGIGAPDAPPAAGGTRMQVVQKVCAVCRRLHDVQRTATKARYCIQCEKLRWQLRAFGGKVHHLRGAYEHVSDAGDMPALLEAAKRLAKLDAGLPVSPAAPAPGASDKGGGARSSSQPPSAAPSSVGVTDGDTDVDMDDDTAAAAAAAADGSTVGGSAEEEGDDSGAAPALGDDDDLDQLAALLAGGPVGDGTVCFSPAHPAISCNRRRGQVHANHGIDHMRCCGVVRSVCDFVVCVRVGGVAWTYAARRALPQTLYRAVWVDRACGEVIGGWAVPRQGGLWSYAACCGCRQDVACARARPVCSVMCGLGVL